VVQISETAMNTDEFEQRLGDLLQNLRGVLIARHGSDVGRDLHAEVLGYAWEHREDLLRLDNPAGYLYRVSQSRARRYRRWGRVIELPPERLQALSDDPSDTGLNEALARLSRDERTVAVLVHAYGYSYDQTAEFLAITPAAVRNRLHRGMAKLRHELKEGIQS
jgi:RNA polymerase sigma factor (sigma-70 family)